MNPVLPPGRRTVSKGLDLVKKAALILAVGPILLPAGARAANEAQITTATLHAGLAAKADTVSMVHTHLRHTINCIVGPTGAGFNASESNPCAKLGNGAIPDAEDAAQMTALRAVVTKALSGIRTEDLAASQKIATDVGAMLKAAANPKAAK
jgi:hypothetical protein